VERDRDEAAAGADHDDGDEDSLPRAGAQEAEERLDARPRGRSGALGQRVVSVVVVNGALGDEKGPRPGMGAP